jgi:hypothetical protein
MIKTKKIGSNGKFAYFFTIRKHRAFKKDNNYKIKVKIYT